MIDLTVAGITVAGGIALSAFLLQNWERHRPKWSRPVPLDLLSGRFRRIGLISLWLESFLMAVGSLLPTKSRSDALLFVSIWGVVGLLALVLVGVAVADAIVRMLARRQRASLSLRAHGGFGQRDDDLPLTFTEEDEADDPF
jgi:hypothetical protein